ncbi:sensor histidine kinase [Paenibacillus pinihumi]|uniref:sensor histidine kinase n=1 Tax=Paenibacillus pinihumi TaxID=669462 RepID=UPI000401617F|nr:sensor histidine kinase [Paenibacillus pinihumi]
MARSKRNHSIHGRLFWTFLSSTMLLLILVSVVYYQKTTGIIHAKISDLAEKNGSQTVGLFDLLLEGHYSITKSINSNFELLNLLEHRDKEINPVASANMERSITNILGAVFYSRDDINGIHIITNQGKMYNYEKRFAGVADMDYASAGWYRQLMDSRGEMVWLGLSQGSLINSLQKDSVFVFGRMLFNLTSYKPIGIVLVETSPAPIMSALSNARISPNSRVYLVDNDSRVVASTWKGDMPEPSFQGLPRPQRKEVIIDTHSGEMIVSAKTATTGWTIFSMTPKADISAELIQTRMYLIIVIGAVVLLSTILASLISRTLSSPLKLLIREMKQVELGHFKGSVNVKSFDEINSLVASFNRMVQRMDELIERITVASISEKNAQLQALQSQVNPHFLYNTLDMIYWMLDERENDRLGRVILALSHMFRYSSDWEEAAKATLRQEMDQMRHYLTIIESRLDSRIHTNMHIAKEWEHIHLPKMTLQPIIENAVKCGLEPLGRPGTLRVYTEADEASRELRVVIADNGIGIDEAALAQLRDLLAEPITPGTGRHSGEPQSSDGTARSRQGIGLPNVHRRLVLMYGESCGLRIDSKYGEGTTVTIVLPLPVKGGARHEYSDRG